MKLSNERITRRTVWQPLCSPMTSRKRYPSPTRYRPAPSGETTSPFILCYVITWHHSVNVVRGRIITVMVAWNGLLLFRVNNYHNVNPQQPFGGFKMSGNGREKYEPKPRSSSTKVIQLHCTLIWWHHSDIPVLNVIGFYLCFYSGLEGLKNYCEIKTVGVTTQQLQKILCLVQHSLYSCTMRQINALENWFRVIVFRWLSSFESYCTTSHRSLAIPQTPMWHDVMSLSTCWLHRHN